MRVFAVNSDFPAVALGVAANIRCAVDAFCVDPVFTGGRLSQVRPFVVRLISVDVVDQMRPSACHQCEGDAMRVIPCSVDDDLAVSFLADGVICSSSVDFVQQVAVDDDPGFLVISEAPAQFVYRRQLAAAHLVSVRRYW